MSAKKSLERTNKRLSQSRGCEVQLVLNQSLPSLRCIAKPRLKYPVRPNGVRGSDSIYGVEQILAWSGFFVKWHINLRLFNPKAIFLEQ